MRILFLGKIGERAGPAREMDVGHLSTIAQVTDALCEDEDLAALLRAPSTITVLDNEIVQQDTEIGGAQELAYLPPVSGG